ncbi:MAG: proline dehydrogenase [Flavobacteriales bacterium]|nr:proline dehydrogenase [Flavobacteriales bacterium]|tara:strand:+ start:29941 stop:31101 length:1161 start_codon:yes stop_codon:yes gene_type:complete
MFNNLKTAFEDKSDRDLKRAYLLFKTISNPLISKTITKLVKIAIWLRLPVESIVKATVYKHFCGGITIEDSTKTIKKLWKSKIGSILDFSAEGKESELDFNNVMQETIESLEKAQKTDSIPFSVFKPTGLARFDLLEKLSNNKKLTKEEEKEKTDFEAKIENICQTASRNRIPVFVDAEESWIQNAIDNIILKMMQKYNTKHTWIYNTIQLYRKDRILYLQKIISKAKENNFFIGLKLVRGAYHEKEIKRAENMNYPCPVHKRKQQTDNDYNKALKICIENLDIVSICAGTHNEESSTLLINLLTEYKISNNDKRVYFSQLLGMSDNISYNTAKKGYNVAKYVPYGPVRDVIPYLIRRANENTSISGQMGRELSNIIAEQKRRKES